MNHRIFKFGICNIDFSNLTIHVVLEKSLSNSSCIFKVRFFNHIEIIFCYFIAFSGKDIGTFFTYGIKADIFFRISTCENQFGNIRIITACKSSVRCNYHNSNFIRTSAFQIWLVNGSCFCEHGRDRLVHILKIGFRVFCTLSCFL